MKREAIILIGGGGHCISCMDVIYLEKKYDIIGILDIPDKVGSFVLGVKVIGTDDDIPALIKKCKNFLITVGQIKSPEKRIRIYNIVKNYGGSLPVIISPKAYICSSAIIGAGTIIMHNSLVNAKVEIGKGCIINTGALIEHESVIGDFCHISTQSIINGQVRVGCNAFIGSNAVITNNVSLPDEIIVAAGACIHRTILKTGLYIGNPARKFEKS